MDGKVWMGGAGVFPFSKEIRGKRGRVAALTLTHVFVHILAHICSSCSSAGSLSADLDAATCTDALSTLKLEDQPAPGDPIHCSDPQKMYPEQENQVFNQYSS